MENENRRPREAAPWWGPLLGLALICATIVALAYVLTGGC